MKYYSTRYGGYPCKLDYFIKIMEGKDKYLDLEECKRKKKGPFYCWGYHGQFTIDGKTIKCGKQCENYNPCNAKSGRCRHLQRGFINTGKWFKLTKNKLSLMQQ